MRVWHGRPYPLGATWDGSGVNFAVFSEHATQIEFCLFDSPESQKESNRIQLPERTNQVWHGSFPDLRPGQLYGLRVHGPYSPKHGLRFNPNKVLLDPYARSIGRPVRWGDDMFGYRIGHRGGDLSFDERDNAGHAPLAVVIDPAFSWGNDQHPRTPWHKTVIYELHVKGFTKLHPDIPERLRGTYAGLVSESALKYLVDLGVTAVELMPVHHHLIGRHLVERALTDYWGYNTISFFAPDIRYASVTSPRDQVNEFKTMVRALHAVGIEVILDVVYNHTGEGNHLGPTLSFRGIDNSSYYRLSPTDCRNYEDFTGCGNTLNMQHPRVLQLIMDSLRYWVLEMHIDGFRFDLASALARELYSVDKLSAFFDIIAQDPVLAQVKLIAEPWDLGKGGYQVGNFPVGWAEWNGKYRDCVRRFWKGDGGQAAELATRLSGSSDLYEQSGRRPYASINFITCHDGFTLNDLVSYNEKHNEANKEGNDDGESHNNSWNCGVEGPTPDPAVRDLRLRQMRNLMATLLLSQGVPMICGGDEVCRTQQGNNNAYCQDNELTWHPWQLNEEQKDFLEFTKRVIKLWREQPVLQRRKFFQGRPIRGERVRDLLWLEPTGKEMTDKAWGAPHVRCVGVRLAGTTGETDQREQPIVGETLLILFNAHHETIPFHLTIERRGRAWQRVFDTAVPDDLEAEFARGTPYRLRGRSLAVFRLKKVKVSARRAESRSGAARAPAEVQNPSSSEDMTDYDDASGDFRAD